VEVDLTVTPIESGVGALHDPIFKGKGYYCVAGGASMYHTICHMREAIQEKNLRAKVTDVTNELGILSVQGQTLHNEFLNENLLLTINVLLFFRSNESRVDDKNLRL
jgi:hypothetical protein